MECPKWVCLFRFQSKSTATVIHFRWAWSGKVQKFGYYTDLWHEFVSITTKASCQNGCKWKAMSESHAKPYIDWASYDLMLFVPFGSVNHHQLCYWPFMNKLLWKICPKLLFHRHILYSVTFLRTVTCSMIINNGIRNYFLSDCSNLCLTSSYVV